MMTIKKHQTIQRIMWGCFALVDLALAIGLHATGGSRMSVFFFFSALIFMTFAVFSVVNDED